MIVCESRISIFPTSVPRNAGLVADAREHVAGSEPVARPDTEKEAHHPVARRGRTLTVRRPARLRSSSCSSSSIAAAAISTPSYSSSSGPIAKQGPSDDAALERRPQLGANQLVAASRSQAGIGQRNRSDAPAGCQCAQTTELPRLDQRDDAFWRSRRPLRRALRVTPAGRTG